MYDLNDLATIKAKDAETQQAILEEFTKRSLKSEVDLAGIVGQDGVIDLSSESQEMLIVYCLLAVFAADIASVPYPEGRARYIERLRKVVEKNSVSYDKVVYLTKYSDRILQELEKVEAGS